MFFSWSPQTPAAPTTDAKYVLFTLSFCSVLLSSALFCTVGLLYKPYHFAFDSVSLQALPLLFRPIFTPETAAAFARELFLNTRRPSSKIPKTRRENDRVHEVRLVQHAKEQFLKGEYDALQYSMQTITGQREFKDIMRMSPFVNKLLENNRILIKSTGGAHKKEIVNTLSKGFSRKNAALAFGIEEAYVKYSNNGRSSKTSLKDAKKAPYTRKGRGEDHVSLCLDMYLHTTTVLSGNDRFRHRNLEFQKHLWEIELSAIYPSFLRDYAYFNEANVKEFPSTETKAPYLTNFDMNVIAAVRQAEEPEHDGMQEIDDRRSKVNPQSLLYICFFPVTDLCLLLFVREN